MDGDGRAGLDACVDRYSVSVGSCVSRGTSSASGWYEAGAGEGEGGSYEELRAVLKESQFVSYRNKEREEREKEGEREFEE